MDRAELLRLARVGAEARVADLQKELAKVFQQFPDLRRRAASASVRGRRTSAGPRRRRPRLSAAARKRISDAQKARWAKQRAEKARGAANVEAGAAKRTRSRKKK